jgi:hypothetical protein
MILMNMCILIHPRIACATAWNVKAKPWYRGAHAVATLAARVERKPISIEVRDQLRQDSYVRYMEPQL